MDHDRDHDSEAMTPLEVIALLRQAIDLAGEFTALLADEAAASAREQRLARARAPVRLRLRESSIDLEEVCPQMTQMNADEEGKRSKFL